MQVFEGRGAAPRTRAVSSSSLTFACGAASHSARALSADRRLPPAQYSTTSAGGRTAGAPPGASRTAAAAAAAGRGDGGKGWGR
jgi:hypothetical protein